MKHVDAGVLSIAYLDEGPRDGAAVILLHGFPYGVDPPPATDVDAPHFTGRYERRTVANVGHNVPQEAPEQFAAAVLALAGS